MARAAGPCRRRSAKLDHACSTAAQRFVRRARIETLARRLPLRYGSGSTKRRRCRCARCLGREPGGERIQFTRLDMTPTPAKRDRALVDASGPAGSRSAACRRPPRSRGAGARSRSAGVPLGGRLKAARRTDRRAHCILRRLRAMATGCGSTAEASHARSRRSSATLLRARVIEQRARNRHLGACQLRCGPSPPARCVQLHGCASGSPMAMQCAGVACEARRPGSALTSGGVRPEPVRAAGERMSHRRGRPVSVFIEAAPGPIPGRRRAGDRGWVVSVAVSRGRWPQVTAVGEVPHGTVKFIATQAASPPAATPPAQGSRAIESKVPRAAPSDAMSPTGLVLYVREGVTCASSS